MSKSNSHKNSPITFEINEETLGKLKNLSKKVKTKSLSDAIRYAIRTFKFENYINTTAINKQISVRLPEDLKSILNKVSTDKKVSVGELLRVAIHNLCSQATKNQTIKAMIMATTTPKKPAARKPVAKTAVKKAPAKKPAARKPVAKKATTSKTTTAKKTVAKKPVAKKPAVKKAVAKKPVAKKPAVKKTTAKKAVAKRPAARKPVARKTTAKKK